MYAMLPGLLCRMLGTQRASLSWTNFRIPSCVSLTKGTPVVGHHPIVKQWTESFSVACILALGKQWATYAEFEDLNGGCPDVNASQPRPSYLLPLNPNKDPWSWYQRTLTFQASSPPNSPRRGISFFAVLLGPISACGLYWTDCVPME